MEKEKIDLGKEASSIEDVANQYLDKAQEAQERVVEVATNIQESKDEVKEVINDKIQKLLMKLSKQ